jgi:hypothetical protein
MRARILAILRGVDRVAGAFVLHVAQKAHTNVLGKVRAGCKTTASSDRVCLLRDGVGTGLRECAKSRACHKGARRPREAVDQVRWVSLGGAHTNFSENFT